MSTPLVRGLLRNRALDKFFTSWIPSLVSIRAPRILRTVYNVIGRIILLFGFITLATSIVTYSGIFVRITANVMDILTNSISNRKDPKSSAD